ncbi:Pkinase-domain-containing protein [Athelia psychrophila]|uniref:Pkinase-domain-containing protein n=1 Tax=Athelia psychrophila TaxID=1759441 RepID=A0A166X8A5_9AGAM|nr:Pkinase-domain-containing protein [Fibularhizoctonia sp. CBS 109695]
MTQSQRHPIPNTPSVISSIAIITAMTIASARYSARFPAGHLLHSTFVHNYDLGEELGSGGYGFVMTAYNREHGYEVAVKFIIKSKISEHAWMEDATYGRLPTEVMLLSLVDHSNIVKCLDLYEDQFCFYLVQELHGSPWSKKEPVKTEPQVPTRRDSRFSRVDSPSANASLELSSDTPESSSQHLSAHSSNGNPLYHAQDSQSGQHDRNQPAPNQLLHPPQFPRRPSHDLFECIEQTPGKRLSEEQACHVFAQIVDAVHYLDCQGITHRDIKDENLLIDKDLKVKLIDFGSAVIADPDEPRPYYTLFFGTIAYASSEILLKRPYQAPPAEVWTLGVLLSYILTGMSPFPSQQDAIDGRIILAEIPGVQLSQACLDLMRRCLEPNPELRADIAEVRWHPWMQPSSV